MGYLQRTILYVLSSLVVTLVGIVVLLLSRDGLVGVSISTGLIAAGLSNVGFVAIRHFDDINAHDAARQTSAAFGEFRRSLGDMRRILEMNHPAVRRRVFDRHPKEEVTEEIAAIDGHVEIDVVGLTLRPFCRDWLKELLGRGNVSLRLLVQDPTTATFAAVCAQESRDAVTMARDALWVTASVLDLPLDLDSVVPEDFRVEVRWCTEYPTITMIRVGGVIYARSRFLREGASHLRTFFERYAKEEGAPFETFRSYYTVAWESSKVPGIDEVRAAIDGLPTK